MNSVDFKKENIDYDNAFPMKMHLYNQKIALHFLVFTHNEIFEKKKKPLKRIIMQITEHSNNFTKLVINFV